MPQTALQASHAGRVLEVGDEFEGDVGGASVIPGVHHEGDGHRRLVHAVCFHRTMYLVDPLCELVPVQGQPGRVRARRSAQDPRAIRIGRSASPSAVSA